MKLHVGPLLSSGIIFTASVCHTSASASVYPTHSLCFALCKVCEYILVD
jgi:hypothetical protein